MCLNKFYYNLIEYLFKILEILEIENAYVCM